ncbi:hypothetical protein TELCIR_06525 [Teladorsagia circumcincta]|uniref:Uncharacterized protein n=1 Tax=Teladorsagia circumcincta TaxID=45464 RepID=A0A2G9UMT7_TELCI|nr:hypothetical protein TELCIR_06525 [Teladorsagia circumcincta]
MLDSAAYYLNKRAKAPSSKVRPSTAPVDVFDRLRTILCCIGVTDIAMGARKRVSIVVPKRNLLISVCGISASNVFWVFGP